MNANDNQTRTGMTQLSRWRLWLLIVLVAFMLPLSGALAADITFDFESFTSPVRDDGATTALATVTQSKSGETISVASTGGKFLVIDEIAFFGIDMFTSTTNTDDYSRLLPLTI